MATAPVVRASNNGLTVAAYPGDGDVLLAYSLDESLVKQNDLAGFAIHFTPPGGEPQYILNRLNFSDPVTSGSRAQNHPWTSSQDAPIQKFHWVHFPPHVVPGIFTYRVTARYSKASGLVDGPSVEVAVELVQRLGNFEVGFTRGYISSQVYATQFKNAPIRPSKTLAYVTNIFQPAYQWLGHHARKIIFDLLQECVNDKSITVDLFAYDIDEPDIVTMLESLGPRLRAFLDNAPLHAGKALEVTVHQRLVRSAGAANVRQGHFQRFAHNKIIIQKRNGKAVKVLTGSANFSVRGLYVQANNVLLINDSNVARQYEEVFQSVFDNMSGFVKTQLASRWFKFTDASGVPNFEVSFAPHPTPPFSMVTVAEALAQAKSSVMFVVMGVGGSDKTMRVLNNLHLSGKLFSYGMTESSQGYTIYKPGHPGVLLAFAAIMKMVPPPFDKEFGGGLGQINHHKFIVIDFNDSNPMVFTGSSSLTEGGESQNGDNLLAISDPAVASIFATEAVRLLDHYNFRAAISTATAGKPLILSPPGSSWWQPAYDVGNARNAQRQLFAHGPSLVSSSPSVVSDASSPTTATLALAGYKSDDPIGEDLLDIGKEVNALASVLAAKEVEPPISLGLFGDWGTGKSFFMRCLESRIRELTEDAKQARGESRYCQDVVQLTFNAWNYIDKDLWASLASEIFEGLAAALTGKRKEEDSPEARALVLAAASSSQEVLLDAERRKEKAENDLREAEERLAKLIKNEDTIEAKLSPLELFKQAARFAMEDNQVQTFVRDAATQLHVAEGRVVVGEVKSEILELQGIWSTLLFTLRNGEKLWLWLLALGLALVLSFTIASVLRHFNVNDVAGHVIAFLTAISGFLAPFVVVARKALNLIQQARASRQELIEAEKQKQIVDLKAKQEKTRLELSVARTAVDEASQTVQALNAQLDKMRADRQMVDFIRHRYESSDYRANLGTIARVRSDFRQLSVLLRDVQTESDKDMKEMKKRQQDSERERDQQQKKPLFPRIDRIILYIDDLDRCPEKNVVEVLQAVHLLLAFPLFIVVVGVDPRWLLHSLKQHSSAFRNKKGKDSNPINQEAEHHWESTPVNYLEKIFQIPFTLRPIGKPGFAKLVDAFALPSTAHTDGEKPEQPPVGLIEKPAEQPDLPTEPALPSEQPAVASADGPSQGQGIAAEAVGAPLPDIEEEVTTPTSPAAAPTQVDRYPKHLQIEEGERAFMKALYELIPSPRAGKRFINIYRLLRASVEDTEHAEFIGNGASGEYQCALLLLGLLTGYPREATEILEVLIREQPQTTWGEFLVSLGAKVLPRRSRGTRRTNVATMPTDPPSVTHRWEELFSTLSRIGSDLEMRHCAAFIRWAPRVARYSFQSGRALVYRRD